MITSVISNLTGLILAYPFSRVAALFFGNLMLGNDAKLDYAFSPSGFLNYHCRYPFIWIDGKPHPGKFGN